MSSMGMRSLSVLFRGSNISSWYEVLTPGDRERERDFGFNFNFTYKR